MMGEHRKHFLEQKLYKLVHIAMLKGRTLFVEDGGISNLIKYQSADLLRHGLFHSLASYNFPDIPDGHIK